MPRLKPDDVVDLALKYRVCCGFIHVQTVTVVYCILALMNYLNDTKNYILGEENDDWEVAKIIFGFITTIGPLIGIKKKQSVYFLPYLIGYILRMMYASRILFSLYSDLQFLRANAELTFHDLLSYYNAGKFEGLSKAFTVLPFLILMIVCMFFIEMWAVYNVYKCYHYISETSLNNEQPFRKENRRKLLTIIDKKPNQSPPTLTERIIDNVDDVIRKVFIPEIWIFNIILKCYEFISATLLLSEHVQQQPLNSKISKKQKVSEIILSTKYRCCYGLMHVQTLTSNICNLFMLYFTRRALNYIFYSEEYSSWEAIKNIFGVLTAMGPLYGIHNKKSEYFLLWFIGPAYRICHTSLILVSLFWSELFPDTPFGSQINDVVNDYRREEIEEFFILSLSTIVKLLATFGFILEIWISFTIYKCFKYISELTLQGEYHKKPEKTKSDKNFIQSSVESTHSIRKRIVEYFNGIVAIFSELVHKTTPPETKITTERNVKSESISISKKSPGLISQWKTETIIENLELMEWDLDYELKNYRRIQSESVNFIVKPKPMQFVEKVIKQQPKTEVKSSSNTNASGITILSPAQNLSISTATLEMSKAKQKAANQPQRNEKKILKLSNPVECNIKTHLKKHIVQPKTEKFVVKLKPKEKLEKTIKPQTSSVTRKLDMKQPPLIENSLNAITFEAKPLLQQNPMNKTTSEKLKPSPEHHTSQSPAATFESNYPDDPKPNKLVSIEVQTEKTLYDPNIDKVERWQKACSDYYNPDTISMNPKPSYSVNNTYPSGAASSGFLSVSDTDCFSPYEIMSPPEEKLATVVTFLFKKDETSAVEICQNGRKERLRNKFDNEWTPLYFSMAESRPAVGEKAQIHLNYFCEHVLYDIFNVIGIPMNEIKYDPKWKFKVAEENGIKGFQIRTPEGLRLFPETSILAAFLKSMKLQAEDCLNIEVNKVYLCTNFELTESQKRIFKDAGSKFDLKVLKFYVNDLL